MNPQKRQRYIAIAAGALMGILVLDYLFIQPMIDKASIVKSQRQLAEVTLAGDESLFDNSDRLKARWNQMVDAGLLPDPGEAANQAYSVIGECAKQEDLKLSTFSTGRSEVVKQVEQITLHLTADGDLRKLTRFIYRVQTATIPLRITQMTVSSRKEGSDDLSLQMSVSTIREMPEKKPGGTPPRTVALAEGGR